MSWLGCHNSEIDWRTEEVKMMRCPEKCEKQWRPKQRKPGWQKQEEEEKRKEEKEQKEKEKKETKKGENDKSKEGGRKIGDLEWREGSSKVQRRGWETSSLEVPQVDLYFWKKSEWENTNITKKL